MIQSIYPSDLRRFTLLNKLNDHVINKLCSKMKIHNVSVACSFCEENEASNAIYFILSGSVSVVKQGVKLAVLKTGEYFGEMGALENVVCDAVVYTSEPSCILELSKNDFDSYIRPVPEAVFEIALNFIGRLRSENKLVIEQFRDLNDQYFQLQENHRQLLQTGKLASIGMLMMGITHEINNPLTVIKRELDVLEEIIVKNEYDPAHFKKKFEMIIDACNSISKMTTGLLAYFQTDEKQLCRIKLNSIIKSTLDLVSCVCKKSWIEIKTDFVEPDPEITGNVSLLQQVLMNLMLNGHYTVESSFKKIIIIKTEYIDDFAYVHISNIRSDEIFEHRDVNLNNYFTDKDLRAVTWSGFDYIQNIILQFKGEFYFEPREGVGNIFHIKIPSCRDFY